MRIISSIFIFSFFVSSILPAGNHENELNSLEIVETETEIEAKASVPVNCFVTLPGLTKDLAKKIRIRKSKTGQFPTHAEVIFNHISMDLNSAESELLLEKLILYNTVNNAIQHIDELLNNPSALRAQPLVGGDEIYSITYMAPLINIGPRHNRTHL